MAQSSFDIEHGLSQPADHVNLQIPHNILQVIGLIEAPALGPVGPPGPQDPHSQVNPVVDDVEGLDQALINFQRIEHESYGRFIRPEPAYGRDELDPQDYWDQDSENESMDSNSEHEVMDQMDLGDIESMEDPPPSGQPNPRASSDPQEQVQHDRGQHQSSTYERQLVAENLQNVYMESPVEQDVQVQDSEIPFGINMKRPIHDESTPTEMDRPAILKEPPSPPPVEEKFTYEMSTQTGPFLSDESAGLTPTASPTPESQLPNTSDAATDLVICDSSLEKIITPPGGDQIRIADGVSVNLKAAANGSAILEDDQEFIC